MEKTWAGAQTEDCPIHLIYTQKHDGDKQAESVVEMLDSIDCAGKSRIMVAQIQKKWVAEIGQAGKQG